MVRPQVNSILAFLSGGPYLRPWVEMCNAGDTEACSFLEAEMAVARARAGRMLSRIGSAVCTDLAEECESATHVALRARVVESVPWSARYLDVAPATSDINLGVYLLDKTAIGAGLYVVPRSP